jgi:hypothetical protein
MRVYFLFDIKEEFINLYKDNERVLYNILKQIYYLDKEEVEYGYNLFKQLINPIDKLKIDKYLFLKLHQDIPYSKRNNIHYYNNLYRDEVSRLTVKKSYIKIEAEQISSSFFDYLNDLNSRLFVCEFKYQDYFFLQEFEQKETI